MKRVYAATAGLALLPAALAVSTGVASADQLTVPGSGKPIDYVIQRALSQRGVPFVYGGGNISGPTSGTRPGTSAFPGIATPGAGAVPGIGTVPGAVPGAVPGTVPGAALTPGVAAVPGGALTPGIGAVPGVTTAGFDASGLIQYAFAGAGIKMPRTSGEQCSVGRKIPPAQARRGDLICYGPGGTRSVAMYLGNGQMIEGTEPAVTVSPARTTNMEPYLTRIIES